MEPAATLEDPALFASDVSGFNETGTVIGIISVPVTLWVDPSGYSVPDSGTPVSQNIYLPTIQR